MNNTNTMILLMAVVFIAVAAMTSKPPQREVVYINRPMRRRRGWDTRPGRSLRVSRRYNKRRT